jgi:hypothetical protein
LYVRGSAHNYWLLLINYYPSLPLCRRDQRLEIRNGRNTLDLQSHVISSLKGVIWVAKVVATSRNAKLALAPITIWTDMHAREDLYKVLSLSFSLPVPFIVQGVPISSHYSLSLSLSLSFSQDKHQYSNSIPLLLHFSFSHSQYPEIFRESKAIAVSFT